MATVKITKLVHACLVIESEGTKVLVDPGTYAWEDPRFDVATLPQLDRVLVTHSHPDHLSIDFVRELSVRFPNATIESTDDVVDTLANHGIRSTTHSVDYVERFEAPHERTPIGTAPQNVGFHITSAISHPGDSHTFTATMPILAIAMLPPWGSATSAVDCIRAAAPTHVIPIHDWHLRPEGRGFINNLAGMALAEDGITFVPLDDFEAVTLDVD